MMVMEAMQKSGWAAGKSFGSFEKENIFFAGAHYSAKGKGI